MHDNLSDADCDLVFENYRLKQEHHIAKRTLLNITKLFPWIITNIKWNIECQVAKVFLDWLVDVKKKLIGHGEKSGKRNFFYFIYMLKYPFRSYS